MVKKAKVVRCHTCEKVIKRFPYNRKHIPKEEILSAVRRHYKRKHPHKFKAFQKKALRTKRKKGAINKKK